MIRLEAPGVEADRDVVGQHVVAGEGEVDQAGEFVAEEEDVVVEQIGVDHAILGGPRIPWEESQLRTIMERHKAGGLNAMVKMIGATSGPVTINFWLGLWTGAISAYSSSSGVVMPMFLPLVPGLAKEVAGADVIAMISSINIGSHLVDTSPLSTLGALCIACAGAHEDKQRLFRHLLIWGLSMSLVGALACVLFFGILGW